MASNVNCEQSIKKFLRIILEL